jgi:hypothetical protein
MEHIVLNEKWGFLVEYCLITAEPSEPGNERMQCYTSGFHSLPAVPHPVEILAT